MNETNYGDFSMEDIYFKDAFTKKGDKLNLEINDVAIDSLISKNNKFSLDGEGNLIVKSLSLIDGGVANAQDIINIIYPIGSIYISTSSINPSTLLGGTWRQIQDRFLVGAGNSYGIDSTGGATVATTTNATGTTGSTVLTIDQIPSHQHSIQGYNISGSAASWTERAVSYQSSNVGYGTGIRSSFVGGGNGHTHSLNSHNHSVSTLPPYLAVNIWERLG
jgi:hypothetical protein